MACWEAIRVMEDTMEVTSVVCEADDKEAAVVAWRVDILVVMQVEARVEVEELADYLASSIVAQRMPCTLQLPCKCACSCWTLVKVVYLFAMVSTVLHLLDLLLVQ